jgi:hypothetical protein
VTYPHILSRFIPAGQDLAGSEAYETPSFVPAGQDIAFSEPDTYPAFVPPERSPAVFDLGLGSEAGSEALDERARAGWEVQALDAAASAAPSRRKPRVGVARVRQRKPRIGAPPGSGVLSVAEFLFSKPTYRTVCDTVNDLREEYLEALAAGRRGKARVIRVRYFFAFVAMALRWLPSKLLAAVRGMFVGG